ncbi:hypothetical protein ACQ4M3_28990 [Leptolyngbya sp. AN03gr2]|uniref:hypothetical protein n=1 Tax=unclassified Leptolyngbya TaxID=2650499 RepID=UPI003D31FCA3
MPRSSFKVRVLFALVFIMSNTIEQVELSCRLRVPATSQYAYLIRYLKEHPYKSIHTFLLDAATAFYLPQAFIGGSTSTEALQNAGRLSISALLAQVTLIAVQVNACLPDGQQLQIPLYDRETGQSTVDQTAIDVAESRTATSLFNPFDFADFNASEQAYEHR